MRTQQPLSSWRNFLDKDTEHLLKIREFTFPDGDDGGVYLVTNVMDMVPEAKSMIFEMLVTSVMILFITGAVLTVWVYQSILRPLESSRRPPRRSGNETWTLPWRWRMTMRSDSSARILRKCGSG